MSQIKQSFTDAPDSSSSPYKGHMIRDRPFLPYYNKYQYTYISQVFTTGSSYTITGVGLKLYQNTTIRAANITVVIQAIDVNDFPTGADLATATVSVGNIILNPAGEWVGVTFDASYILDAATDYAIVIRPENPGTEVNDLEGVWWTSVLDNSGRGARYFFVNGGVPPAAWSLTSRHFNFVTYADAVDVEKLSPGHNSIVSTASETLLDWEDPGSGATKYSWTLTYEHPISGTSIISATVNAPTTEKDISSPISSIYDTGARECTWTLRPYIGGEYIADSDPWTLEIVGPPAKAISPTPTDTATSIAMAPLLQWGLDGPLGDDDYFFIYLNTDINKMSTAAGLQVGWRISQRLQILSGLIANTTYYWQVHVANTQGWSESAIWSFTTRNFASPTYSTRERLVYGEPGGPGDPEGDPGDPDVREYETVPSGENNMLTVRRLIVAARNRIYYEDF